MDRKVFLTIATSLLFCCGAWAQTQSTSTTGNNASNAASNSGANIYQEGDTTLAPRQFPYASSAGIQMPFPGGTIGNGPWTLVCPAYNRETGWSREEVDDLKHQPSFAKMFKPASWGKRFTVYRFGKHDGDWGNDHRIMPICWSPYEAIHPGDKVLAIVDGFGDYGVPDDVSVAAALASGIPKETMRVVRFTRTINTIQTNAHAFGIAAGGAIAPNSDNKGVSATIGANFGSTNVQDKDKSEIRLVLLNAGPLDAPKIPEPQRPVQQAATPAPPPLPQVVQVQLPPITINIPEPEWVKPLVEELRQQHVAPPPAPETARGFTPAPPAETACETLPELTIYFDFDRYVVKDEYLPKIKEYVTWLSEHPQCHVQVQGHTCTIGSAAYNANLGRNRAKAIYDQVIADGASTKQVEEFASLAFDKPANEYKPENRRVILRIIGAASGK